MAWDGERSGAETACAGAVSCRGLIGAPGVANVQLGTDSKARRPAASAMAGETRQEARSYKIMLNLLSKNRPDPATPNAGDGDLARENSEQT